MHVSVVIPAFNSAGFIGETLSAILHQTQPPERVIVVDDGSTDDTGQVVQGFGPSVTYIRIPNGGQGAARKYAIEHCQSDWIALCDSDDIWKPDHLARREKLIRAYPKASFTFSDCFSFGPESQDGHHLLKEAPSQWLERWCVKDQSGFYTVRDPYCAFLSFNPAYPSGIVFRRDDYLRMGGFLPKYSRWIGEDTEFVRRFLLLPELNVVGDSYQSWGYRRHTNNYSKVQWRNIESKARILQEHLDAGIVPTTYRTEIIAEIDRALTKAFDIAYWKGHQQGISDIYPKLPPTARTLKRRAKYIWAITRDRITTAGKHEADYTDTT